MNKPITIGTIGAGRAAELHYEGLRRAGMPVRLKTIMARRSEQLLPARERYGYEQAVYTVEEILRDPEIDVVDICTPPYAHTEQIIAALRAGKHVICEKPLTGYFGRPRDKAPIGQTVPKKRMYQQVKAETARIRAALEESGKKFMYAENFVYAPAVAKAGELIRARKSRILYMKGEESLKGSSSPVAGEWSGTGGGIFIRNGVHPLGAILWLKQEEARARGVEIGIRSVQGDMGYAVGTLSQYEHRHIAADPRDVEDSGTAVLTFTDGTKAVVIATDDLLGGSKNVVELYCNDAAMTCRLTMNNAMDTYLPDEDGVEDVYLSEMLPIKTGWNSPFIADDVLRGYSDEMRDFLECLYDDRQPRSGFDLAESVIHTVYAAYAAAESGRRIDL